MAEIVIKCCVSTTLERLEKHVKYGIEERAGGMRVALEFGQPLRLSCVKWVLINGRVEAVPSGGP